MGRRDEIISFGCYDGHYGWHKGFYNDGNPDVSLSNVSYTEFFDIKPEDVNFAYDDAFIQSAEVVLGIKKVILYKTLFKNKRLNKIIQAKWSKRN